MKIRPALTVVATAAATAVAMAAAPVASADTDVQWLGQPGELVNGSVVQHWTVSHLKPSTDVIPYRPVGALWEATASDEAISGNVMPIVSNLNARAKNGDTYRVLFGVATPQGVNPATLAQGQKTSGKIYFDVTGAHPDSVFYSSGGPDELLWLQAPPAPATTGSNGSGSSSSSGLATSPSTSGAASTATPATPGATPAAATPASVAPTPAAVPAGSVGTPLPEGSVGTPLPQGSVGTPLPEGAAPAEAVPAPVPAAVNPVPADSAGTPLPQSAAPAAGAPEASVGTPLEVATPAPAPGAPTTTVVVPAPPA